MLLHRQSQVHLARYQRALARKVKFSSNWKKQKGRITQLHSTIAINQRNTSRTCPCCKHIAKENRLTQAKFECVECGYAENADLVGAINILAAGHAVLACAVTVQQDRTVKHEPAEGLRKASL